MHDTDRSISDSDLEELIEFRRRKGGADPTSNALPNGGRLIRVPGVSVEGWNRPVVDVLFVAPPGYPFAQPDCFCLGEALGNGWRG